MCVWRVCMCVCVRVRVCVEGLYCVFVCMFVCVCPRLTCIAVLKTKHPNTSNSKMVTKLVVMATPSCFRAAAHNQMTRLNLN